MLKTLNHKAWIVGGSVRDEIMGLVPKDLDIVVEATEEEFREVFPCEITVPKVGNSFPVFLVEGNEVALTRTEECVGNSYQEFSCVVGVPIEHDLLRRDFTVGSLAKHFVTGEILDPHDGIKDIGNRLLRCVNPVAFTEDPLRILRGARFAARFNFEIEEQTMELMKESVENLVYVTKERVVLEMEKMYEQSEKPSVFFNVLAETGALAVLFPDLDRLRFVTAGPNQFHHGQTAFEHSMDAVDRAKECGYSFSVAISALMHDTGKGTTPKEIVENGGHHYSHENRSFDLNKVMVEENRFDAHTSKLILLVAKHHMRTHLVEKMKPVKLIRFFRSVGAHNWELFLQACDCDHPLTDEKKAILDLIKQSVLTAKVEVPKTVLAKGREATVTFVENVQVNNFKSLNNNS